MVIDTSALVALLTGEPEAEEFGALIAGADDPLISAGSLLEASVVLDARLGPEGVDALDQLLVAASIRVVAVDDRQARIGRDAYRRFGKGRHAAALNYGDGFAYALASTTDRPLLLKGDGFVATDVDDARHTASGKGR